MNESSLGGQLISSLSNATVKQIRALRHRKERDEAGTFFVEGIRLVGEALQMGASIQSLIVAPELLNSDFGQRLVTEQKAAGTHILGVTPDVFASFSSKDGPQGLAAVVHQNWTPLEQLQLGQELWVALDEVADPGNLGTIMRTADAVGASGVILIGRCTDPYDPSAVRASMGSIFAMTLVRVTYEEFQTWKRTFHYPVVGASGTGSVDYQEIRYPRPLVVLSGSEREGLHPELLALCDHLVRIP
ncbi:MAG: TrmH family RNA methyltransferase, partial [Bacillota bacterium]